jgi:hypothetical protein
MDPYFTRFKNTLFVRLFAFLKIPLLWWVRPELIELGQNRVVLKIPLSRRSKNHLGAMYFGALAMGAEACVAIKAINAIRASGKKVDFIFKDFHADFLKRAEGDVHFICEQGQAVESLVAKCISSGNRETEKFESYAVVPANDPNLKVATFSVSLSVKSRTLKS